MHDIFDAIEDGDVAQVTAFLDQNPALLESTPYGDAPLHTATYQRNHEIVQLLLDRGADYDKPGVNGLTPLHIAASRGMLNVGKLLLEAGASLDSINDHGYTPMLTAAKRWEPEFADLLIEYGAELDLASAVTLGRVEAVKQILDADPGAVDRSPFREDLLADAVYTHKPEFVKLLLAHPSINATDCGPEGEPPLVAAVSRSDYSHEIVRLLVENGADKNQRSPQGGRSAVQRARSVGIKDVDALFAVE